MTKYHVSKDGVARPCRAASSESCTAIGVDGEGAPHGDFSNPKDASRFAEGVLEKSIGEDSLQGVNRNSEEGSKSKDQELAPVDFQEALQSAPRVNIGMTMVYGNVKGIKRDFEAGRIDENGSRARLAAVAADIKSREEYDITAQRPASIEYRKKLEAMAGDAKPAKALAKKPEWKNVLSKLHDYRTSRKYNSVEDSSYTRLADKILGIPRDYEGYSEVDSINSVKAFEDKIAKRRTPEAKELKLALRQALASEGK